MVQIRLLPPKYAPVAQWLELAPFKREVGGSNPLWRTNICGIQAGPPQGPPVIAGYMRDWCLMASTSVFQTECTGSNPVSRSIFGDKVEWFYSLQNEQSVEIQKVRYFGNVCR